MTNNAQVNDQDEREILALFEDLVEKLVKDFPKGLLEAREELLVNGELNQEKYLLKLAEMSDAQARAAYIMSTHAAVARSPDAKAMFEHWAATFQRQRDIALAPGLSAGQRLSALDEGYRAGWGQQFEAFGRTTSLGDLLPRVSKIFDAAKIAAALASGDEKELAGECGSILGGMLGGVVGHLIVGVSGAVGWPAAVIIAAGGVFLSLAGEQFFEGPLFDLVSSDVELLPSTPAQVETGRLGADDAFAIRSGNRGYVFAGEGNDVVFGNDEDDLIDGAAGEDTLRGAGGGDTLIGGNGNDLLVGGAGSDALQDEGGFDTYAFSAEDLASPGTQDTIEDADGLGRITFNSLDISGTGIGFDNIRHASLGDWETSDGGFRLAVIGAGTATQSLLIIRLLGDGSVGGRILVRNWQNGGLGITLPGFDEAPSAGGGALGPGDELFGTGADNAGNNTVNGGGGNDGLSGGAGNDVLDGGAGDDLIFGFTGDDRLSGGDGNDYILDGSESVSMRDWSDDIFLTGTSERQRNEEDIARLGSSVLMRGRAWYVYNASGSTTIHVDSNFSLDPNQFASGNDVLDGGAGNDVLRAGEGNDILIGGVGNDVLDGGHDDDTLSGGDGDDRLLGDMAESAIAGVHFTALVSDAARRNGNDIIDAGAGSDFAAGQGGNDIIYGGLGNDTLRGRGVERTVDGDDADSDYIDGGDGDDQISGDDGDDTLLGGAGADTIRGDQESAVTRSGNDTIDGGAGDDLLFGDGGNDTVEGGDGADTIVGDATGLEGSRHGNDVLSGGAGDDTVIGLGGSDVLRGGNGNDSLQGDGAVAAAFHGNDQVYGGAGNDHLFGGGGNDVLDGGADNDLIFGDEGDDTLTGGDGIDELSGGEGRDSLSGGNGNDRLFGEAGDDSLVGGSGDDILRGGEGIDVLSGGDGVDDVIGGEGNDAIDGGAGNDTLWGHAGNDRVEGGAGNDYVDGDDEIAVAQQGNDELFGGAGNDVIFGRGGNDLLDGGVGDDELTGGVGNDAYVFNAGWGKDRVFALGAADAGLDVIRFGAGIAAETLTLTVNAAGSLVVSTTDGNNTVELVGFFDAAEPGHRIEFADGTVWTTNAVATRLSASGAYFGGAGNDVIVGQGTGDMINGGVGNDILHGGAGDDVIYGGRYTGYPGNGTDDDALFGGAGSDTLDGETGADWLEGGVGSDRLFGGLGADVLRGGEGHDTLYGDASETGSWFFAEAGDNDILEGGSGNDTLVGGLGVNRYLFASGFGNDFLRLTEPAAGEPFGLAGERAVLEFAIGITASSLILRMLGDTLLISSGSDSITVTNYGQRSTASLEFVFADGSSLSASQLSVVNPTRTGSDGVDRITGSSSRDVVYGMGGDDVIDGMAGNDVLDGGDGNDVIFGNRFDAVITDNDTLRGGRGDDELHGASGDDTYLYGVGDGTDSIYEVATVTGTDILRLGTGITPSSVTVARDGAALILVTASVGDQIRLEGFFDGVATGNFGVDRVEFSDGTVWLASAMAEAVVYGTQNNMVGGTADDNHVVDHHLDTVSESANAGIDTVLSSISYVAEANVENVTLTGSLAIDATGNGLANTLRGNAANNTLSGGAGVDTAFGGGGNDTYHGVENILEDADGGFDTRVYSAFDDGYTSTVTLAANVERLVVSDALNGQAFSGNELDNVIVVLSANSNITISGGAGADFIDLSALDLWRLLNVWINVDHAGDQFLMRTDGANASYLSQVNVTVSSSLSGSYQWQSVVDHYLNSSTGVISIQGNDAANVMTITSAASGSVAAGGQGDDRYILRSANVQIDEGLDGGLDTVEWEGYSAIPITLASNVENLVLAESSGSSSGAGNSQNNVITGNSSSNALSGGGGDDVLSGGGGNDTLDGGSGNDQMSGDGGNDNYYVDSVGDVVVELASASQSWGDRVFASIDYTLTDNVEYLTLLDGASSGRGNALWNDITGNSADNQLFGGDGGDVLRGEGGNDRLEGEAGADVLLGGIGNDLLLGGGADDRLQGDDGADTLEGGAGNDQLEGGLGSDTYVYRLGDGNDTINEAASQVGTDVLQFGEGVSASDVVIRRIPSTGVYRVEVAGAVITLQTGGVEEIRFFDGTIWQVADHVADVNEAPVATGFSEGILVRGKPFEYSLSPGFRDTDSLRFHVGNLPAWMTLDPITGMLSGTVPADASNLNLQVTATDTAGQSVVASLVLPAVAPIEGTAAADSLSGTAGRDFLYAYAGNDTLNGNAGNDDMYGGAGDDTYTVDANDRVVELAGEGNDLVNASVTYRLGANVERLTLTGSGATSGFGNELDNTLTGNGASNELDGGDGNDTLVGNGGNDNLRGGAGNDSLNGGSGSDVMSGGAGDDSYFVDAAGDSVQELVNEGVDTVQSSVAYTLGSNLENLTLTGTSGLSGSGNALDNVLVGNSGANTLRGFEGNDTLDGGAGNDTMIGGVGDDTYIVNATGDVVTEAANEGRDTVQSSVAFTIGANVENLTLTGSGGIAGTGNALDNVLIGNSGNNSLTGLAGNDTLEGRAGTDTLTGGTGSDTYVFGRGYGSDTVVENDATAGVTDVARFLAGVAHDQLWFSRPSGSNNLEISIIGTSDKMVIKDWFLGAQYRVEEIRTADGNYLLTAANVQALVNAMAAMTRPTTTTLSTAQRAQLAPTLAATWVQQTAVQARAELDQAIGIPVPGMAALVSVSTFHSPFGLPALDAIGQEDGWEERWEYTMREEGGDYVYSPELWRSNLGTVVETGSELQGPIDPTTTLRSSQRSQLAPTLAETWLQQATGPGAAVRSQTIDPTEPRVDLPPPSIPSPVDLPIFECWLPEEALEDAWIDDAREDYAARYDQPAFRPRFLGATAEAARELQLLVDAIAWNRGAFDADANVAEFRDELGVRHSRLLSHGPGNGVSDILRVP